MSYDAIDGLMGKGPVLTACLLLCCTLTSSGSARAEVFARADDLRPLPPEKRQREKVFGLEAELGGVYYGGNVDHYAFTGRVELMFRIAKRHELFLDGSATHSFFGGEAKIDRDNASLLYVFGFHPRWNLFGQSTHSRNRFLKLDYRTSNGLGVCFHGFARKVFDTSLVSLAVTPENEWWSAGSREFKVRAPLRFSLGVKAHEALILGTDLIYMPVVNDPADFRIFVEVFIQAQILSKSLSFKVTLRDEFDSRPIPGVAKNDVSIMPSLVVHGSL